MWGEIKKKIHKSISKDKGERQNAGDAGHIDIISQCGTAIQFKQFKWNTDPTLTLFSKHLATVARKNSLITGRNLGQTPAAGGRLLP